MDKYFMSSREKEACFIKKEVFNFLFSILNRGVYEKTRYHKSEGDH